MKNLCLILHLLWCLPSWAQVTDKALLQAIKANDLTKVQVLLAQGANVNARTPEGNTPLMLAALHGNTALCMALLEAGADPALQDSTGKTALDFATEKEHTKVIAFLSNEEAFQAWKKENDLGEKFYQQGLYKKGMIHTKRALTLAEENYGKISPYYASSMNNLASLYQVMGRYREAEPLFQQALEIRKAQLGEQHPSYASSLNNLAELYRVMGRYREAEPLFQQALEIRKTQLGKQHPDYASSLSSLAELHRVRANYQEAEPLFQQALEIRKVQLGEQHPDYATSLNNLAMLHRVMGRYREAEPLFQQALEIRKAQLGEQHPDYAVSLHNMALLYRVMGHFGEAEPLFQQALEIRKAQLGEQHPSYASSLNNLAELYRVMGRYREAEPLFQQAQKILREQLGEDHRSYATSLHRLAGLYNDLGHYSEAESLFRKALEIRKAQLGEQHPDYAVSLYNLALLYRVMGRYREAEPLFQQALKITRLQLTVDHPFYAASLNSLAELYQVMGRYREAEPLFQQALEIRKAQLGEQHPDYATSLNNLAILYRVMGRYREAEPFFVEANRVIHHNLQQVFTGLSEKEKQQYLQTVEKNFQSYHSFVLSRKDHHPAITTMSFDNALIQNGMLLQSSLQMRAAILQSRDSSLLSRYDQWMSLRQQLSQLYSLPVAQHFGEVDSLEEQANQLEKILNSEAAAFRKQTEALQTSWLDVQQALSDQEAAVEFIHFRYYGKAWSDSTFYVALVLRKADPYPQMIRLCTEAQLDSLLTDASTTQLANQLYDTRGIGVVNSELSKGQALYQMVWQPLDALLTDVHTVYFSPSGRLHQIAFAALPYRQDSLLMDRYKLHQLSSTRIIAQEKENYETPVSAALFGGIHYDADTAELLVMAGQQSGPSYPLPEDTLRSLDLTFLPATQTEVEVIAEQMQNEHITVALATGIQATEERFKQLGTLAPAPSIVHVATHGYFFANVKDTLLRYELSASLNEQQQVYRFAQDPLHRAGLLFAGASHAWRGKDIPKGLDDGILTAYEASQLNLHNTVLVVLSACETALGQIQGSEGVYGLQRAFKMAGADYLIMSLWQVPDQETQEMMQIFYRYFLHEKLPIRAAFLKAQQQMRQEYDPYYWAAFTLVE